MKTLAFGLVTLMIVLPACAASQGMKGKTPSAPSTVQTGGSSTRDSASRLIDYDDIPVPREMEMVPRSSLLFETPEAKAGVLFFEGRVDPVSLFDYFKTMMPNHHWELRSYFKYGRYIMVFEKPDKDCIITIHEKTLTTELQMWVTPRARK